MSPHPTAARSCSRATPVDDLLPAAGPAARDRDRVSGPRRWRRTWTAPPTSIWGGRSPGRAARTAGRAGQARDADGRGEAFADLGVAIQDADAAVAYLSGGQRQGVAVARAASWASKVIIMDEPTAALGVVQSAGCSTSSAGSATGGWRSILISHNMPEVLEVADRIEVLRLGRRVATFTRAEATLESLVGAMTGALQAGGRRGELGAERHRCLVVRENRLTDPESPAGAPAVADLSRLRAQAFASTSPRVDLPRAARDRRRVRRDEAEPVPVELRHQDDLHQRVGRADAVGGDDVRDHHRRHRPVGRLGAGDVRRAGRQGDDRRRRRRGQRDVGRLGPDPRWGWSSVWLVGVGWGAINGATDLRCSGSRR